MNVKEFSMYCLVFLNENRKQIDGNIIEGEKEDTAYDT